jgi:hypothetical protein
MALCPNCRSIPFRSIVAVLSRVSNSKEEVDQAYDDRIRWLQHDGSPSEQPPRELYPWIRHSTVARAKMRAATCVLCKMMRPAFHDEQKGSMQDSSTETETSDSDGPAKAKNNKSRKTADIRADCTDTSESTSSEFETSESQEFDARLPTRKLFDTRRKKTKTSSSDSESSESESGEDADADRASQRQPGSTKVKRSIFRRAFYPSSSAQRSANTRKGAPTKSRGEGEQRVTYVWLRLPQPLIDGRAGLRLFYGDKVKPNTRSTEARLLVRTTLSKLRLMNIDKKSDTSH